MLKIVLIANSSYQQTIGNFQHNCPAASVMRLPACNILLHATLATSTAMPSSHGNDREPLIQPQKNMAAIISHDEGGNPDFT